MGTTLNNANKVLALRYQFNFYSALCIGLCFCMIGIMMVSKPPEYDVATKAKITTIERECKSYTHTTRRNNSSTSQTKYRCLVVYEFEVNGETYTGKGETNSGIEYTEGMNIDIEYKSSDPSKNRLKTISMRFIGGVFMCMAVVAVVGTYIPYLISKKVKGGATALTAAELFSRR